MSGSDTVALTLLGALGGANASLSMLQAIYGQTSAGAPRGDPLTALKQAEANRTTEIARTEQQPEVARDIAAFQKAVAGATDAASLLKNPDFLKVLLTANGLGDQVAYPALAQKALLSDPADKTSLVVRLANQSWTDTNTTYQFGAKGLAVIQDPAVQARLADAYAEVRWRESLDEKTPGLSSALTFRAEAAGVSSAYDILGDKVLRDVVTTALGLPQEIAIQPVETQAAAITSRLDLSRLKDARFVDTLTQRYLLDKQASAATASGPSLDSLAAQAGGLWV
jgi:hypothetical protein